LIGHSMKYDLTKLSLWHSLSYYSRVWISCASIPIGSLIYQIVKEIVDNYPYSEFIYSYQYRSKEKCGKTNFFVQPFLFCLNSSLCQFTICCLSVRMKKKSHNERPRYSCVHRIVINGLYLLKAFLSFFRVIVCSTEA
jgi:hypothetical protein